MGAIYGQPVSRNTRKNTWMSVNREILWVKCQTIAENSLYTAQGHFEDAHLQTVVAQWLLFTPAIVSFLAGAYILFGAPPLVGVFALLGGLASGLATALGVSHGKDRHIQAANAFTVLRHDCLEMSILKMTLSRI